MIRSIRSRLTIVMICLAVIPMLLLGSYVSWQAFRTGKQQAVQTVQETALRVAIQLDSYLNGVADNLALVGSLWSVTKLSPEERKQFLEGLMSSHYEFAEISLLDDHGLELVRLNRSEPFAENVLTDRSSSQEFLVPFQSRQKYFGKVFFLGTTGEPCMKIGIPVLDPLSGKADGVLVGNLCLKKMRELISELDLKKGESALVLDASNRIVAHKNPSLVLGGTSVRKQPTGNSRQSINQEHSQASPDGRSVIQGEQRIKLGNEELLVLVEWDAAVALREARILLYTIVLATITALGVAVAVIIFLAGIVVRPVQSLTRTVRAIRAGDLSLRAEVRRGDEIGELAQCLNSMTDNLQESITELETEVTDRKNAQMNFENAHALLQGLIDSIPDLIFYKDRESTYLGCNRAFSECNSVSDEQIIGMTDYDLFVRELAEIYRKNDSKLLEMKKSMRHEEWVDYPDGRKVLLETVKTPYYSIDGVILGIIGISRDITERSRAEAEKKKLEVQLRQAQKMEAIGTLAGGIAHDFNNILAAIIGFTELSRNLADKDSNLGDYLGEVLAAGNRAKDLVRQILTFSRMQEQSNLSSMQIQPIAKEALKLLRASIPTTIAIKQDIQSEGGYILANPTQVHQILINLCTNAYHAMQETGGVLMVRLYRANREQLAGAHDLHSGVYTVLEVSDTGVGMDSETLDRIFEPYFTTKEQGKGTGMGLSVVHGIVRNYGGHINVTSAPGKGSTFQIFLPQVETIQLPRMEESVGDEVPHGRERILLVDDEKIIAKVVKKMMEGLGYMVQSETSSLRAYQLFSGNPDNFDLIITDMTMPEMTGLVLAEKIKALRPDIPIILCSGHNEGMGRQKLEQAGINAFLPKPLSRIELSLLVRKVLDERV